MAPNRLANANSHCWKRWSLRFGGQNRAAALQQAKANHDFVEQETELKTNTQLTREIHALSTELQRRLPASPSR